MAGKLNLILCNKIQILFSRHLDFLAGFLEKFAFTSKKCQVMKDYLIPLKRHQNFWYSIFGMEERFSDWKYQFTVELLDSSVLLY